MQTLESKSASYRFIATPGVTSFTGNPPGGGGGVSNMCAAYNAQAGTIVAVAAIDVALALSYDWLLLDELGQGTTLQRPTGPRLKGLRYYDTTISAQVIYDGTRTQWYRTDTGAIA